MIRLGMLMGLCAVCVAAAWLWPRDGGEQSARQRADQQSGLAELREVASRAVARVAPERQAEPMPAVVPNPREPVALPGVVAPLTSVAAPVVAPLTPVARPEVVAPATAVARATEPKPPPERVESHARRRPYASNSGIASEWRELPDAADSSQPELPGVADSTEPELPSVADSVPRQPVAPAEPAPQVAQKPSRTAARGDFGPVDLDESDAVVRRLLGVYMRLEGSR